MLGSTTSLNDPVRPPEHRCRDREAKGLRGLEVDNEVKLCHLFHGQVCRLRTPEDLVHKDGSVPVGILVIWVIAHQTAGLHEGPSLKHCRQPVRKSQFGETLSRHYDGWGGEYEHGLRAAPGHGREGAFQLARGPRSDGLQL